MYVSHTTKDGLHMQICDLSDSDLLSILNTIFENIRVIRNSMRSKENNSYDPFKKQLGEGNRLSMDELKASLDTRLSKMYPYVAEAALRGFDLKNQMQEVFERGGQERVNESAGIKQLITMVLNNLRPNKSEPKQLE